MKCMTMHAMCKISRNNMTCAIDVVEDSITADG